ncbi:arsenite efflux transporter metallochaperone ArsD [Acidipropionibacterium virtanenii]|uniref:Arsenical resistance operon trans-acting repressor ArsD n=1 Tax=Acidipropionibacterium virtanenii TaxID=2057246 RepID=A0A344UQA9_9ACTN|nr:arsenite efflux transporter metallochaperone ArsD [Acidipropionibacterium virtanenii]AXE37457.1 Arsenical resistance operon trans-acting repressor ArsD [Acidipropionibacterium virtanenii]
MPSIRVYEPALCCNTGVCGPDVDQDLVTFTADLDAVQQAGADADRANPASEPQAFAASPAVLAFMNTVGSEGLPLTLVDGATTLTGRYPTRDEMLRWTGLAAREPEIPVGAHVIPLTDDSTGCCGGAGAGCC